MGFAVLGKRQREDLALDLGGRYDANIAF